MYVVHSVHNSVFRLASFEPSYYPSSTFWHLQCRSGHVSHRESQAAQDTRSCGLESFPAPEFHAEQDQLLQEARLHHKLRHSEVDRDMWNMWRISRAAHDFESCRWLQGIQSLERSCMRKEQGCAQFWFVQCDWIFRMKGWTRYSGELAHARIFFNYCFCQSCETPGQDQLPV